ncbi:UDP-glucose 4-epimerase family protein [Pseudomonas aeruginosa]|uniref:UDP-glucose 4-epimerase family protein n=1 Tax=Pseudomonas aeruginosa TaxID=287 RepID=UPI001B36A6DA|nr:SDR family oxidoreductase [Pseudomonas aeruginosa]MBP8385010.1 SDR family oxidoreductase [Pseudomonas aeruginosa]MBP8425488.1 SDR family oxidoreductase [Pseudomonas aeruginosa]HEK1241784.1 SDR family oxidoreductase [Pseudomonas aeruginosa]
MSRILVTGASGFVGRALSEQLQRLGHEVVAAARSTSSRIPSSVRSVLTGDLCPDTDWSEALQAVDIVIHAAARVHVMNETLADPLQEFRKVNVEATLNLARQAASKGIRRFIFISSIKVNGEATEYGRPYRADDEPRPIDPYGLSKLEAERGLLDLAARTGIEVVIIRPVLVYGPGVKANFLNMMKVINKKIPLPFLLVDNRRSLVALTNLVDLITSCLEHPSAANQVFLVSDDEDLSTSELLKRMGIALGAPARLLPVPVFLMKFIARMLGKGAFSQRLLGSLQVDISKTKGLLAWHPPLNVDEALKETARHFLDSKE